MSSVDSAPAPGESAAPRSPWKKIPWIVLAAGVSLVAAAGVYEMRTSHWQAGYFWGIARKMTYRVQPGPSDSIRFPVRGGPYDLRLGYAQLPQYVSRLQARGFVVSEQAVQSADMVHLADHGITGPLLPLGLFEPYHEKDQAGLSVLDEHDVPIFESRDPQRVYTRFEAVPKPLVDSLLYIENHTLLDAGDEQRNPAVEWTRFTKALVDEAIHLVHPSYRSPGASTLATQIEKFRHSPEGRTDSPREKLRQMLSASVHAYLDGKDTTKTRRHLVVAYLNTVPLAARPGFGEISGIGDGLWAWYGRSFDEVNRALGGGPVPLDERATVFKEALSLMISQRSPSFYLNGDMKVLEGMTNAYLKLMAKDGVITPALRDAALKVSLRQQREGVARPATTLAEQKGANGVRLQLARMLGIDRLYDLNRLDLSVRSTIDATLQRDVTRELLRLRDARYARAVGLDDRFLLPKGSPAGVTYSFTLVERTPQGNKIRVQADNFDQPFDINEGTKLDLGSTSKLRTLVTYLEIVRDLHTEYAGLGNDQLAAIPPYPHEPVLRRWAIDYLRQTSDRSLAAMIEAALERTYSADPAEQFFTGGGIHTFENFEKSENGKTFTVREATIHSVNLAYIRLMRDVARYYEFPEGGDQGQVLDDPRNPRRREYLERFADREGRTFLADFYDKYRGKTADEDVDLLIEHARHSPRRLSVIFRSLRPDASPAELASFLAQHLLPKRQLPARELGRLYDTLGPDRFGLADRAYIAGVHPLDLWLVGYLQTHPAAGWSEIVRASADARKESYQWLYDIRDKAAQDQRIKEIMEVDAFRRIHQQWVELGYPFDSLVPSYATALGASADRPAALAELMGILSNDGVRRDTLRINSLHFAQGTPYDTTLVHGPTGSERMLPPEITQAVRAVLAKVVDEGTARRAAGAFDLPGGVHIAVGGKTGTGDNRYKTFSRGGELTSARVVSRSGAFAFYLGDRYFGTVVAYVAGPQAADYVFTSALPVQILKILAPTLIHHLDLAHEVAAPVAPPAAVAAPASAPMPAPVSAPTSEPASAALSASAVSGPASGAPSSASARSSAPAPAHAASKAASAAASAAASSSSAAKAASRPASSAGAASAAASGARAASSAAASAAHAKASHPATSSPSAAAPSDD
jgi:membrane peptidoglycan carboxypeptidase